MVNQNNSATDNEYIVDFAWAGLSLYCDGMKTMLTNALTSKTLESRMLSYGVTAKFTVLGNLDKGIQILVACNDDVTPHAIERAISECVGGYVGSVAVGALGVAAFKNWYAGALAGIAGDKLGTMAAKYLWDNYRSADGESWNFPGFGTFDFSMTKVPEAPPEDPTSPTDPTNPNAPTSPGGGLGSLWPLLGPLFYPPGSPGGGEINPFSPPGGGSPWSPFGGAGQVKWDPIILDLDGDGIELTTINNGTYFDLDTSGFAERTGWVKADDGLLVQDRNGDGIINDGQELFGNQTLLKDGSKADSGFQALDELDSNFDGKIDASDGDYAKLRVWRDLNGDGYSSADELFTLNEFNIQSVSLTTTVSNINNNGSTQVRTGSYQKQDGTSLALGEFLFDSDSVHSIDTQYVDVSEEIAGLPYLQGYSNVHDLWQAMTLDTSGSLQTLVQSFAYEKDSAKREQLLDQILYKWTNSDTVSSNSRGSNIDARQLTVLEKMFGQQFTGYVTTSGSTANPNPEAAKILKNIYAQVQEYFYDRLMMQTHLADVFNAVQLSWDEENSRMIGNVAGIEKLLDADLKAEYSAGIGGLREFVRVVSNMGLSDIFTGYDEFSSYFVTNYGEDARLIFEAGGRNIIYGSDTGETLQSGLLGSLVKGGGGNDVVQGSTNNDVFYGDSGNDSLYGQAGDDILNGGEGIDYLNGGAGNDTYIWGQGAGNDTIQDGGDGDVVQLTEGLTADALDVYRAGLTDLQVKIKQTGELLTISNWFGGSGYQPQVKLGDGTILAIEDMINKGAVSTPTENADYLYGGVNNDTIDGLGGNDVIYGSQLTDTDAAGTGNDMLTGGSGNDHVYGQDGDDTLAGGNGNDNLYGSVGNDVLDGGVGNDYLNGGAGNDSYIWGLGVGNDTIYNNGASGDVDVVQITGDLTIDSVDVLRLGASGLQLKIKTTGETLTFNSWYAGSNYQVTAVNFADGTMLTAADIVARAISVPTEGDDYLYGGAGSDTISGLDGDDYLFGSQSTSITAAPGTGNDVLDGGDGSDGLYGQDGDDTLLGGMGSDYLYGGVGNDSEDGGSDNDYLYGHDGDDTLTGGSGNDELYGSVGNDVLDGGAGNDYLNGGAGKDSYVWGTGVGNDTIYNDGADGDVDIVQLTGDLTADSFEIYGIGSLDLQFKNKQTGETLTFANWYAGANYQVKAVNFADGTVLTAAGIAERAVAVATEDGEYLYGGMGNDTINGLGGDDQIYGSQSTEIVDAIGTGDDLLEGGAGDDGLYGQDGDDTLVGGSGNDYLLGGAGDDTLTGGSGNDSLYGGSGNDVLGGGAGNDDMGGGAGNDTYIWGQGVGNDTIYNDGDGEDVDIVQLTGNLTADSFEIYRTGYFDLQLKNKQTGETLTFANWYVGSNNQVTAVNFADGTVLTADDMMERALSVATENSDCLYGGMGNDTINGLGGDDQIYGSQSTDINVTGTGDDLLEGGAGDDELYGQDGDDTLVGGSGDDYLYGGAGNDSYVWGIGVGNDTIYNDTIYNDGTSGDVDIVQLTGDLTADSFEFYSIDSGNLQLKNKQTGETLTFADWYDDMHNQVTAVNFADGTVLTAVDMMERAVSVATEDGEYLYGGPGNDTIDGLGGDDEIYGSQSTSENAIDTGDDMLVGGDGRDNLYGQDGDDTLLGGSGNDYLYGGAGNDSLDGESGNDYVIGGEGDDTLTGRSGDDYLYGEAGNDVLVGGGGNDDMGGGAGNDSYIWGTGVGNDTIYNEGASGDVDIVQLIGDLTADSFDIYPIGFGHLRLKNKQTGETLTFNGWYDGTHNQVTAINFADGTVLTAADMMERAVSIATENDDYLYGGTGNDTINGLGGDDQIFGSQSTSKTASGTGNDILDGGDGNDYISGGDGDDTILGGSGNDYLYEGAGNDNLNGEAGNDYMTGGDGDDTFAGGSGDDYLYGEMGNDVLDGGAGNDILQGGLNDDIYLFGVGSGKDIINSYEGTSGNGFDTLQFQNLILASIEFAKDNNDLVCTITQTGETIRLSNWTLGTNYQVDQFQFADGVLNADQVNQKIA